MAIDLGWASLPLREERAEPAAARGPFRKPLQQ